VFITEVLFCLDPKAFVAGVMITQKGEVGSEMYLLASGDVELLQDDHTSVVKVLPAGSYFGEEICLGLNERQLNVRAKTNCRVCCLAKDDLNPLLDQWPGIRDNIRAWYEKRMDHFQEHTPAEDKSMRRGSAMVSKNKERTAGEEGKSEERLLSLETEVKQISSTLQTLSQLMVKMDSKLEALGAKSGKLEELNEEKQN